MAHYLGKNLNRGHFYDPDDQKLYTILDGREAKNPAAQRFVHQGNYLVTKRVGQAPEEVRYYGIPVGDMGDADQRDRPLR